MKNIIYIIPDQIKNIKDIVRITDNIDKPKYDIRFYPGYAKLMKYLKIKEYPLGYSFIFYKIHQPENDGNISEFIIDGGFCKIKSNEENDGYELTLYRKQISPDSNDELEKYLRKTAEFIKSNIAKLNSIEIDESDTKKFINIRKELANMYYSCRINRLELYSDCLFADKSCLEIIDGGARV